MYVCMYICKALSNIEQVLRPTGVWQKGVSELVVFSDCILLKHRHSDNSLQKSPCPVVICPYLCSSEIWCAAQGYVPPPQISQGCGGRRESSNGDQVCIICYILYTIYYHHYYYYFYCYCDYYCYCLARRV